MKLLQTIDQLPQEDATLVRPSVLLLNSRNVIDSGSSESDSDTGAQAQPHSRTQTPDDIEQSNISQGWGCLIL